MVVYYFTLLSLNAKSKRKEANTKDIETKIVAKMISHKYIMVSTNISIKMKELYHIPLL